MPPPSKSPDFGRLTHRRVVNNDARVQSHIQKGFFNSASVALLGSFQLKATKHGRSKKMDFVLIFLASSAALDWAKYKILRLSDEPFGHNKLICGTRLKLTSWRLLHLSPRSSSYYYLICMKFCHIVV